ncbi:MAG: 50S ribosomal protein L13 [Candidatus Pacebacteria bacterium]|nr:50S ribosomal protein L13 [Candidatus Paceibacterota bacterium]
MEKAQNKKEIYTIDAEGKVLGRLATQIVSILRGKNKPDFMPNKDSNNYVVVKNISKIKITGQKLDQKTYFRHTGYLGGDKHILMRDIFEKNPGEILRKAVSGMLPKNRLRDKQLKRIKFE